MKNNVIWIAIALIVVVGLVYFLSPSQNSNQASSAPESMQNIPPAVSTLNIGSDAKLGNYLTASNGMTLYVFSNDEAGVSNCNGTCAVNWPPYLVSASNTAAAGVTGTISTVFRADGSQQIAYNGLPLYFWKGDMKAGDTTGNGVGGVWSVARP